MENDFKVGDIVESTPESVKRMHNSVINYYTGEIIYLNDEWADVLQKDGITSIGLNSLQLVEKRDD